MTALLFVASPFIAIALIAVLAIILSHRENMAKIKMGIDPDAHEEEEAND